ncbi:MAG: SDR family NAD(P)-dependent oxidoreductase [Chthoniobacterales bacterium]|nr:SDR family NAD(P)-dependent oxidoreductase [Chthoniobacterales bacterium]
MKKIFLSGASSGIGRAIADLLIARGDEVWGTSRSPARIPSAAGMHPVALELMDARSIEQAFEGALAEAGYFDVVINNAGAGDFGPFELNSEEALAKHFQLLVLAHVQLMRLALTAMRAQQRGLIVNVTSLASRLPVPFMAPYNAAKAAMASYTMTAQLELADEKIRLVDLQAADIRTSFNDSVVKTGMENPRVAKVWDEADRNMKKAPKPKLVARRVLRLLDEKNPPPRITVGDFFQAHIAPFIFRFLPQRLRVWGLKFYYGI